VRLRILVALIAVSAMGIALFGLPLAEVVQEFYRNETVLSLERQATEASGAVPRDFAVSGDPVELPTPDPPALIALYDPTGTLVTGNGPAAADSQTTSALAGEIADTRDRGGVTVAVPITSGETIIGAIRIETTASATNTKVYRAWGLMAGLALIVLTVTAIAAWFLARRLSRPVQRLTRSLDLLGAGSADLAIEPSGVAEIDEAQNALAATAERLDEVLARERAFSAEASHQLRTPIASLRLAIETELADPRPDPATALHEALIDVDRLDVTTTALLELARPSVAPRSDIDIGRLASGATTRWTGPFGADSRPLRLTPSKEPIHVVAREAAIDQALDVLLDNALTHGHGETTVAVNSVTGGVTISVQTEGPPITSPDAIWQTPEASDRPRIGLPLARRLIESEGGRLILTDANTQPRFEIVLPASQARPSSNPNGDYA
jgi:signal transduction histidine kinase